MVKYGKNKFKALNKIAKKQNLNHAGSNKILKKKLNADKKVNFHKTILKEVTTRENPLVKKVSAQDLLLKELSKKTDKVKIKTPDEPKKQQKVKAVEKKKKRRKTQLNDTKLLLQLIKKNRTFIIKLS